MIFKALQHGCLGYILKSELENITETIDIILKGGAIISPMIALRVMKSFQQEKPVSEDSALTTREKQVIEELASGYTPAKVAELMNLSLHTVRTHIKNIYRKLNVNSSQELLSSARKMKLI